MWFNIEFLFNPINKYGTTTKILIIESMKGNAKLVKNKAGY